MGKALHFPYGLHGSGEKKNPCLCPWEMDKSRVIVPSKSTSGLMQNFKMTQAQQTSAYGVLRITSLSGLSMKAVRMGNEDLRNPQSLILFCQWAGN